MEEPRPIGREEETILAETLPDDPLHFGPRCVLRRHVGAAWVSGPWTSPRAAVVVDAWQRSEPNVYGTDPDAVWELLRRIPGWWCVDCPTDLAGRIAAVLERELGERTRRMDDVYYVLRGPPTVQRDDTVRRLTEADLDLVERAPKELFPVGFDSALAALAGGVVAGAVVRGALVARTSLTLSSEGHADIASHTLVPWRGRGYASAALSLVAAEVQARGLVPVWSTGETNAASRRVALKVGFEEFGRKTYVIVPSLRVSGGYRPSGP